MELHLVFGLGWRNGSPIAPSYDQGTDEKPVQTIDYLFEFGFYLDVRNEAGDTPLHSAVSGRVSQSIVACLLDRGANPLIANERGQTVQQLAETRSTPVIAAMVSGTLE